MALPLFCEGLGDDLSFEAFFGVHLFQALVLFLQLLHTGHERGVHAAKLGSPLVERGRAHAMFAAQFGDGGAGLGLLEDGDDLTVCVTGRLHAELSKIIFRKFYSFPRLFAGGITKDHPDFLIALDTEAGLKPNDPLLARDDRIKDEFASVAHALRRAERTISDIPGEELLERFRERDGIVSYSFTWESYSKQNDVFRPMLALEFSTDHSSRPGGKTIESGLTDGAALALWNKISSTIRLRPTQVVQVPVAEVIPPSLGAIVHANEACPATGWWQCDVDYVTAKIESGARQYFRKGDRMPQAVMLVPPTLGQRLQRQQPRFQSEIPTRWKLVQLVS